MNWARTAFISLVVASVSGCGTLGAAISNGPTCPYQGVHLDLAMMTNGDVIVKTFGSIIALSIIDIPFSFIFDTINLQNVEDTEGCPRRWN